MRSDENLPSELTQSDSWKEKLRDSMSLGASLADSLSQMRQVGGNQAGKISSLSGHERNPFFYNRGGRDFSDLSILSGADSDQDGRSAALWDFNRDGFMDLAVINSNAPRLAIYQNKLAKSRSQNGAVFLKFEGANSGEASSKNSNRDGYGCVVTGEIDGKKFRAEHQCGCGFAAQNSATMHLGIGKAKGISKLTIRWPSGKETNVGEIAKGSVVTCSENGEWQIDPY